MELNWQDVYTRAVEAFGGQTPGQQLEAAIVERFESQPAAVVAAIDKLGERFTAGRVHSPWPLVLRELDAAPARSEIRASDDSERQRSFQQAERYIRQIGYLHQSEQELRDELAYRKWPADERLVELWRLVRPIGERTEREQLERAERWKASAHRQQLGNERTSAPRTAQPLHLSQTSAPLTSVSDRFDPDADIDWQQA